MDIYWTALSEEPLFLPLRFHQVTNQSTPTHNMDSWPDQSDPLDRLKGKKGWTAYQPSAHSLALFQGHQTDDQNRNVTTPLALLDIVEPSSDATKDTAAEDSHSEGPESSAFASVPTDLGPMTTNWILPRSVPRELGPRTRLNQTIIDAKLGSCGPRQNPTSAGLKTTRVMFMSDTGETHTMTLNEAGRYLYTASRPTWVNPKKIRRSHKSDDGRKYLAIPLTETQDISEHTLPPTCSGKFDEVWEAATGKHRLQIVEGQWPTEWQTSKWQS